MNVFLRSFRRIALPAHAALRKRKVQLFFNSLQPSHGDTLLDVGGGTGEAGELEAIYNFFPQLTCLNLSPAAKNGHAKLVVGDACHMPFESRSFDFVFSNAVIEHVGEFGRQQQMANEIRRVARKGYFVATPNRWFPIDPHSYLPYFQLMPLRVRRLMNPDDDYWMLSAAAMRKLFPESSVVVTPERTSIIAIGNCSTGQNIQPMPSKNQKEPVQSRKLRLALFGARGIPSTYSGTETFFIELAPRLVQRGHQVIVYCRRSLFKERPPSYKGVRLIYLPSMETKNLGTFTHTLACMIDVLFRNVDAMLVTNVANSLHCIIPRLFRQNCAINVDGIEWKRGKWGRLGKWYFHFNARMCGKILPRGIVTDAYAMRKLYLEEFNTPSACIAYGGNIDESSDPRVVRQYGLEPGNYYLIASRLVPENNAALIVEGFKKARPNRVLAIAGDANYRSEFVADLKANAGDRVRFLGHVDNIEHVKELHCNCYAYIHGHMMGGTNPALLKALGFGNLVLAHDNPFNAEVLAGHGLLFRDAADLASKIELVENDPALAQEYRRRAQDRVRDVYNWERITDQYEELFYLLANGEDPTRKHSTVRQADQEPVAANS